MDTHDSAQIRHFHDLLSKFETAMLVTHTGEGDLRARPMAIAQVEEGCRVWFFTGVESGKVHEIESDTHVSVVCQRDRDVYLSLSGVAVLNRDRAKVEELWKETLKTWFPKGKSDPNLALVVVEPATGEYWDQEGFRKIEYLFQAAKAYATGTVPAVKEGDQHAKVQLA